MHQSNISLTVAVCTHNNAPLLAKTLESLEMQVISCAVQWSVLVVDNLSRDETQDVIYEFSKRGNIPDLRWAHEVRLGLVFARRRAILESASELLAFVDDDCLLDPDWVYQAVLFYREHSRAGAVGGKVQVVWEQKPDQLVQEYELSFASQDWGDDACQLPSTGMVYLVGAGLVVSRTALLASHWMSQAVLFDRQGTNLTAGGDSEMVLRIRKAGYEIWFNPQMRLRHYIPSRRVSMRYLCGLYRGFGRSHPYLWSLGYNKPPCLRWRLRLFLWSFKTLIGEEGIPLILELLSGKRLTPQRRLGLHQAWGRVEGALDLLARSYRL